jgi:hypothetical protein
VFVAIAVSGASSDGFHTVVSPQTAASIAFQPQTAFGKLNAVMTPIGPSGSHCSISRCCGRSLGIVSPCNWRESPTAKSAMSIVSCTSPSPSDEDLADLKRDERAQRVLVLPEFIADGANDLPTGRRGDGPPALEGVDRLRHRALIGGSVVELHVGNRLPGGGIFADDDRIGRRGVHRHARVRVETERAKDFRVRLA